MRRVIRFRLHNEIRGARYWEEEKRMCRICGGREETWEHVMERYTRDEEEDNWWERMREILG